MLKLEQVSARYETVSGYVNSVDHVSFEVRKNEIMGIAGESGCGKSTLLKTMYDLVDFPLEICGGKVTLTTESSKEKKVLTTGQIRKEWWREISYVPQGAMHVMNPVRKVREQFFDVIPKEKRQKKAEQEKTIAAYLKELELPHEVLDAYPHQLSGGMRQRVIIALATFLGPDLVLADEPTTALDVTIQEQILNLIAELNERMGMSVLFITHDLGAMAQICHSVRVMYLGNLVEEAQAEALFARPLHPYTQGLLDCIPRLDSDRSQPLHVISGVVPPLSNVPEGCRFCTRCPYADQRCMLQNPPSVEVYPGHKAKCWKYVTEQEVM